MIIQGDLLEIKEGIILHQVNCIGVTGGLAGALHRKYPVAFGVYDDMCKKIPKENLGGMFEIGMATYKPKLTIGHVFGQIYPGPNTDMRLVRKSLEAFRDFREKYSVVKSVETYAPYQMGCGLGGGSWTEYMKLLYQLIPEIKIIHKQ